MRHDRQQRNPCNCGNCLHDCKVDPTGNWRCGAWKPQPPSPEEAKKVRAAIDQILNEMRDNDGKSV